MGMSRTLALAAWGLVVISATSCATTVPGHGALDASVTSLPTIPGTPTSEPTSLPTTASPTLDPASERRVTCLLVLPAVSKAVRDWNDYVDRKRGTRASVAASLSTSGDLIDSTLHTAKLAGTDAVRTNGLRIATELRAMAKTLQGGGTPGVDRFNTYKRQFQGSCPK
ncbi:MAG TPA: hypothetical protein VLJ59_16755 [Mycobacteriales bacterium]|nr:hypothetical protein [Mycobacteriales bacterium]